MLSNPYSLGPTSNARLLGNRRGEIRVALDAIHDREVSARHALVLGDARTGRTSVLQEIRRRLHAEAETLVVEWRVTENALDLAGLVRGLFSAIADALLAEKTDQPDWYRAWCNRVYLRDRSPMTAADLLASGLAFASDAEHALDPTLILRDLRALSRLAVDGEKSRLTILVDDADVLLEDNDLVEFLAQLLEDAGNWHLVMASRYPGAEHLVEAASPALRQIQLVPLRPLWVLNKIKDCLVAPLEEHDADRLLPGDSSAFLMDVLYLTSGNPFEIALVGQVLWFACQLGEQEVYELTPKVVDRVLSEFARYTGAPPEVRAGARAVRELPPERVPSALELIALSELTPRQVAVARMLGVPKPGGSVNERLLTCNLDAEESKVIEELEYLEEQGIVSVSEDGHFSVHGGRQAAVALKYHARSFTGQDAEHPFGIPYIICVGDPLSDRCAATACAALAGAKRVASGKILSTSTYASAARLRTGLESRPFVGLEVTMRALDGEALDTVAAMIERPSDATISVVNFTITVNDEDFNLVEIWSVPRDIDSHTVNQTLSDAVDEARPLIEAAGLTWSGASQVLFTGEAAQAALVLLCPEAAVRGLRNLYSSWANDEPPVGPTTLASRIVEVLRTQRPPDPYELSSALSRQGFMLSLCAGREAEALEALQEALERGPADGWVTIWNLVVLEGRCGEHAAAMQRLRSIESRMCRSTAVADVSFCVPHRSAAESLLTVNDKNVTAIYNLQAAVLSQLAGATDREELDNALADCAESDPEGMKAAKWVFDAFGVAAHAPSADLGEDGQG